MVRFLKYIYQFVALNQQVKMTNNKVALIILDGWGKGDKSKSDAIFNANTPCFDGLLQEKPHCELLTSGLHVGLPEGQMGNSEVGHLNIGAGRIVDQDLVKINKAISNGTFFNEPKLLEAFSYAQQNNRAIHFMGLVSDGGVHSHTNHLKALCDMAAKSKVGQVYIHAFTDGRDTDPKSGLTFISEIETYIENMPNVQLASIIGRYYSMDRDKRWERVKKAYDLLISGEGTPSNSLSSSIAAQYEQGTTDEFLLPIVHKNHFNAIDTDDVVICFNFRTDRCREITEVLTQKPFPEYNMSPLKLKYYTMTNYDETFKGVEVVYDKENLSNTIGQVISEAGKTQVRIAETEKYPHVTFFFSGGREKPFTNEKRILVNSPKVATYDLKPEMSAWEVTEKIVDEIENSSPDFICLNFANPDMVGHTGVYEAIIKAVETVDSCLAKVVNKAYQKNYDMIIIADHGNADYVINDNGTPNTAHTTNPVPCILVSSKKYDLKNGILADVAPTILELMEIKKPPIMTGKSMLIQTEY